MATRGQARQLGVRPRFAGQTLLHAGRRRGGTALGRRALSAFGPPSALTPCAPGTPNPRRLCRAKALLCRSLQRPRRLCATPTLAQGTPMLTKLVTAARLAAALAAVSAAPATSAVAGKCLPKEIKIKGHTAIADCGSATAILRYKGATYRFKNGTCLKSRARSRSISAPAWSATTIWASRISASRCCQPRPRRCSPRPASSRSTPPPS